MVGLANGGAHPDVGRQVQRVDDRGAERGGETHGRRIERVVVYHIVRDPMDRRVHSCKRLLNRPQVRWSAPVGAVERASQPIGRDAGVNDVHTRNFRAARRVDVHRMSTLRKPTGQVGEEGLRAARLRFTNRCHQRCNERDLHSATGFQARSRGGLAPTTS